MAVITGTIKGATLTHKTFNGAGTASGRAAREVWLLNVQFPAHVGTTDTAELIGVGAAIKGIAEDQKSRTLRWASPGDAGYDSSNTPTYFCGTTGQAIEVSSDDLLGQMSQDDATDAEPSDGVIKAVSVVVGVTVATDTTA